MSIDINSNEPIFIQLKDELIKLIISNKLKNGEKLLSVREMSIKYKINPNTIQKSLQILEDMGLIFTDRTNGKYVTEDRNLIEKVRKQFIAQKIDLFCECLSELNVDYELIANLIKNKGKKEDKN